MKTKIILFVSTILLIIGYLVWINYMSEPKYKNNPDRVDVELYDFVSIRPYGDIENNLDLGLVIQIDTISFQNKYAVVKTIDGHYKDIQINGETRQYKIIGTGTFYHKVNAFIGFNIFRITNILIIILGIILVVFLIMSITSFFEEY